MDKLTKIIVIINLTAIIGLFFISQNYDFNFQNLNNMTEKNRDVTIQGRVIQTKQFNNSFMLTLETNCRYNAFYYDKKHQHNPTDFLDQVVEIKGTIQQEFNPSVNIKSLNII